MQAAHERSDHSPNHDVMKMRHHKVGVGNVNIDSERRQKQTGQSANSKETDETEGIQHWSGEMNRAFVQRGCPVENLNG